jgi:transcriptional regulator with XRE-family HTH domain
LFNNRNYAIIDDMVATSTLGVSRLIRGLREEAGLTQGELARRVGTTQSVISRLEGDAYEGHSLTMLCRIGAALDRQIAVTAVGREVVASVREGAPEYCADESAADSASPAGGLSGAELERLVARLVDGFGDRGLTRADVDEAIRWARGGEVGRALSDLQGAIKVGPGDVVEDVRRARSQRGQDARALQ